MLAGCVADPAPTAPLFGYCPQWMQGPGSVAQTVSVAAGATSNLTLVPTTANGTIVWEFQRHPFDMVRLHIDSGNVPAGATLQLKAVTRSNGTLQHNWRQFSPDGASWFPSLQWGAGPVPAHDFETFLSSVDARDRPVPQPMDLSWSLEGSGDAVASVSYTVTFHYKVCGAQV